LGGATGERFGYILSNTGNSGSPANQITYTLTIFSPNPAAMTFATGDSIEIRKVDNALDQPGMGQATDLIQDVTHTVTTTAGSANIGWTGHGLNVGTSAYLTLNGVTTYYFIISRTTDAFQVSKSPYGPAIVSSSSGSTSATVT